MTSISLQPGIIYGPVLSRRLGRSLGINILPTTQKVCSFNCIYCQYGYTSRYTLKPDPLDLPTISDIIHAVEKALKKPRTIDNLTFSGNGEPTLHPDFPEIVKAVKELRDRFRPSAKLVLLSNASTIINPKINEIFSLIDTPMLKLDAGDEETLRKINQPVASISFHDITVEMKRIRPPVIQSVLIDGAVSNIHNESYEAWAKAVASIHPQIVHIYSTERPTPLTDVKRVSPQILIKIKDDLQTRFDLRVEAFWQEV